MLGKRPRREVADISPCPAFLLHGALESRPLAPDLLFIMHTAHVLF